MEPNWRQDLKSPDFPEFSQKSQIAQLGSPKSFLQKISVRFYTMDEPQKLFFVRQERTHHEIFRKLGFSPHGREELPPGKCRFPTPGLRPLLKLPRSDPLPDPEIRQAQISPRTSRDPGDAKNQAQKWSWKRKFFRRFATISFLQKISIHLPAWKPEISALFD